MPELSSATARQTTREPTMSRGSTATKPGSSAHNRQMLDPYHNIASTFFNVNKGEDLEEAFLLAARNGDIKKIEGVLKHRNEILVNLDARDNETGNTSLIWAAKRGYVQIVQLLLRYGADATLRNYEGQTAVEVASPQLQQILVDSVDKGGPHRTLLQAAWQGNVRLVQKVLSESRSVDINCRNADGLTPLLLVARDLPLFEKLGQKDANEYNPLEVVELLLDNRADPNAMDDEGRTALHYASSSKSQHAREIIETLLHDGSDVELRDRRCLTPIHWASQSGNSEVVEALLEGGSDANVRGYAGTTPLHVSAINGHDQVAVALLKHGADVTIVDDSGLTPVDVAKTKKVKVTLKQAWTEATQCQARRNLGPVRDSALRRSSESPLPVKKGQVMFDLSPSPRSECHSSTPRRRWSESSCSLRMSQVQLSLTQSSSSFDAQTPRKAALNVLQRQLTHVDNVRKNEEMMLRSMSRMSNNTSPTQKQTSHRLTPLRNQGPRRKELKFSPCTKPHDGTVGMRGANLVLGRHGQKKTPNDAVRLPPTSVTKDGQIPVTILGLDLDESIEEQRCKRGFNGPVGQVIHRKGHFRNNSDPSATCNRDGEPGEDFCLRGRSSSKCSITALNEEWECESDCNSSLACSPPRFPASRMGQEWLFQQRTHATIEEEQYTGLDLDRMQLTNQSRTPIFGESVYPTSRKLIPSTPMLSSQTTTEIEFSMSSSLRDSRDYSLPSSKESSPRSSLDTDDDQPKEIAIPVPDIMRSKSVIKQGDFNIEESRVTKDGKLRRSNDSGLPDERNSNHSSLASSSSSSSMSGSGSNTDSGEGKTVMNVKKTASVNNNGTLATSNSVARSLAGKGQNGSMYASFKQQSVKVTEETSAKVDLKPQIPKCSPQTAPPRPAVPPRPAPVATTVPVAASRSTTTVISSRSTTTTVTVALPASSSAKPASPPVAPPRPSKANRKISTTDSPKDSNSPVNRDSPIDSKTLANPKSLTSTFVVSMSAGTSGKSSSNSAEKYRINSPALHPSNPAPGSKTNCILPAKTLPTSKPNTASKQPTSSNSSTKPAQPPSAGLVKMKPAIPVKQLSAEKKRSSENDLTKTHHGGPASSNGIQLDSSSTCANIDSAVTIRISSSEPSPPYKVEPESKAKMPMLGQQKEENNNKTDGKVIVVNTAKSTEQKNNTNAKDPSTNPPSLESQKSTLAKSAASNKLKGANYTPKKIVEHNGPVISDPFEAIRAEQNREEENNKQERTKSGKVLTRPAVPPRKTSAKNAANRQSSATKKGVKVKGNQCITEDAIGINHRVGKKGAKGKKQSGNLGNHLGLPGREAGNSAFVSGKGWHIRTDCNEDNTIKPVKFVNPVPDSSEDEDEDSMSTRVLPNYLETDDDVIITSRGAQQRRSIEIAQNMNSVNLLLPGAVVTDLDCIEDDEDDDEDGTDDSGAEEVLADEVIFFDNSPNVSPRLPDLMTPRQFLAGPDVAGSEDAVKSNMLRVPERNVPGNKGINDVWASEMRAHARSPSPINMSEVAPETTEAISAFIKATAPASAAKANNGSVVAKPKPIKPVPNTPKPKPTAAKSGAPTPRGSAAQKTGFAASKSGSTTGSAVAKPGSTTTRVVPFTPKNSASTNKTKPPPSSKEQSKVPVSPKVTKPSAKSTVPTSKPPSSVQTNKTTSKEETKSAVAKPKLTATKSAPAENPVSARSTAAPSTARKSTTNPSSSEGNSNGNENKLKVPTASAKPNQSGNNDKSARQRSKSESSPTPNLNVPKKSPRHDRVKSPNGVKSYSHTKAPKTKQKEDAELEAAITEILKSTPNPSMSFKSQKQTEERNKSDPEVIAEARNRLKAEINLDTRRSFQELPVSVHEVTTSHQGATTPEEEQQLERIMNSLKNTDLKVHIPDDTHPEPDPTDKTKGDPSNLAKPPLPKKSNVSPKAHEKEKAAPKPEKTVLKVERSPRFIRKKDSWKDGDGEMYAAGEAAREDEFSGDEDEIQSFGSEIPSLASTLDGDNTLVPADGRIISSRMGHRSCTSRCASAMMTDDEEEVETFLWKRGNMLGKGAYGTVWCGLTNVGEFIAVKQIELDIDDMDKAEEEYEKIQEEVKILKTLKHKNIVGYLGTSLEDSTVSIFMQFVPGGSIANNLARFGAFEEEVFLHYTKQILEGVDYLHANNVIHRDIKGGNVMVMHNGIIKLIDFGCAKRLCLNVNALNTSQKHLLKSMRGTPYWMAPEVVKEIGYGTKSDIWSIGCTVFEMATRKPPWAEMAPMAAIFAIGSDKPVPQLPAKFSKGAIDFVLTCMTRDQNQRPSAAELLQHSFILKKKKR